MARFDLLPPGLRALVSTLSQRTLAQPLLQLVADLQWRFGGYTPALEGAIVTLAMRQDSDLVGQFAGRFALKYGATYPHVAAHATIHYPKPL